MGTLKKLNLIIVNDDYSNVYLGKQLIFRIERDVWLKTYKIDFIDIIKKVYVGSSCEDDIVMIERKDNEFKNIDDAFEHCYKIMEKFVNLFIEEEDYGYVRTRHRN
jgi:hypothetical protein